MQTTIAQWRSRYSPAWVIGVAFATLAIPTGFTLARQEWSRETAGEGAIILITGAWLLWSRTPAFRRIAEPGKPTIIALCFAPALAFYVFGRAYDFITLETAGLYGVGVTIAYAKLGGRVLIPDWFSFTYPALAIPPPAWLLAMATSPLKRFASFAATSLLQVFGLPVAHEGVTIYIAQYQLLVADACSGMNSIVGLIALSLFYVYLVRPLSLCYAFTIAVVILPISIIANIVRVVVLILITYYLGDDAAQGFLHFAAGILLFAVALLLVYAFDTHAGRYLNRFLSPP